MGLQDNAGEYIAVVGKASPPLAVSGAVFAGFSLQDWVLIATLVYTALQIVAIIRKWIKDRNVG